MMIDAISPAIKITFKESLRTFNHSTATQFDFKKDEVIEGKLLKKEGKIIAVEVKGNGYSGYYAFLLGDEVEAWINLPF